MDTEPSKSHSSIHNKQQAKILTIDDDDLVRESIVIYLEDCGYDVYEASTGEEGIDQFRKIQPDLVLCDLRMPGMDGLQALKIMTKESPETPVIVISGAGLINDAVEALRLGATDYLVKPISDFAVLQHAIDQAFGKIKLEKENSQYKSELEVANKELQSHLNVLQEDQEAGRRAQIQLLPPPSGQFADYSFNHIVIPSLNLSGDFLDYFEINERFIGFYIADVSGHGSASAFVTMMLKSLFNQPLRGYRVKGEQTILKPDQVLSYLNQELISANLEKYVMLFYGVIDLQEDKLHYSIGGHFPRPLLIQKSGKTLFKDRGFPVGMFDWANYQAHEMYLDDDFILALFSDGVLECIKFNGGEYEEESLKCLEITHETEPNDIIETLKVREFEQLPDDVSIFLIKKNTSESK